jgi:hypothetical protein
MSSPLQPNNILWKSQIIKPQNLTHFFSCILLFHSQILITSTCKTAYRVFLFYNKMAQRTSDFMELAKKSSGLKVYILI